MLAQLKEVNAGLEAHHERAVKRDARFPSEFVLREQSRDKPDADEV
jgi:hypothetical protein